MRRPRAAAALQFPLAHPIVAPVIPGAPKQVRQNVSHFKRPIPAVLWSELKRRRVNFGEGTNANVRAAVFLHSTPATGQNASRRRAPLFKPQGSPAFEAAVPILSQLLKAETADLRQIGPSGNARKWASQVIPQNDKSARRLPRRRARALRPHRDVRPNDQIRGQSARRPRKKSAARRRRNNNS